METGTIGRLAARALLILALSLPLALTEKSANGQLASTQHLLPPTYIPEQRTMQVRDPSQLRRYELPELPPPPTVTNRTQDLELRYLTLDEAIRIALANGRVVRVLAGNSAIASGSTIYDAALTNVSIDQANARFDPTVTVNQSFNRLESPSAIPAGTATQNYNLGVNVSKQNALGGTAALNVTADSNRLTPGVFPLNPSRPASASLSYTQPLLQGGRLAPNMAPVMLARIDTERSYFQLKDSVQEQTRGVIEAYWNLVFARTDVWARRKQLDQLREAVRRIRARVDVTFDNRADQAQAELAMANARANLVSSEANVLQREAALRNILGIPPSDNSVYVPVTPPMTDQFVADWPSIVAIAQERRPDLIELKLILEADNQLLLQANNNALPRLDAVGLYRWNGLEGELPGGTTVGTAPGQFTDWTLGVNFSVPIGLRAGRAGLRRVELLIARDRANLDQGMHSMVHSLATNVRSLDQAYENYAAFKTAREAARVNLDFQILRYQTGAKDINDRPVILLNVLQAIADWGNTISGEANALAQYNVQLATLERQTGTILETHGVFLYEERYGSIGPLGRFAAPVCYPESNRPTPNDERYGTGDEPAEESFNLKPPREFGDLSRRLPDVEESPNPPEPTSNSTPDTAPVPGNAANPSPVRQAAATEPLPLATKPAFRIPLPRFFPTQRK